MNLEQEKKQLAGNLSNIYKALLTKLITEKKDFNTIAVHCDSGFSTFGFSWNSKHYLEKKKEKFPENDWPAQITQFFSEIVLEVILDLKKTVSGHANTFISLQFSDPSDKEIDLMQKISQLTTDGYRNSEFENYLEKIK